MDVLLNLILDHPFDVADASGNHHILPSSAALSLWRFHRSCERISVSEAASPISGFRSSCISIFSGWLGGNLFRPPYSSDRELSRVYVVYGRLHHLLLDWSIVSIINWVRVGRSR